MEGSQTRAATDGRRLKGQRRRRALIDATVRTIGRVGVAGVSQRVVAAEAGVPPSAIAYYFPTIDELLLDTLRDVNDGCIASLAACGAAPAPLDALAEFIAAMGRPDARASAVAEYELFMLAGRGQRWQREYERWAEALTELLTARCGLDPSRAESAAVAVDGLFIRAVCLPATYEVGHIRTILASVTGPATS